MSNFISAQNEYCLQFSLNEQNEHILNTRADVCFIHADIYFSHADVYFSYADVCYVDVFFSCGVGWRAPLIKQSKSDGYQIQLIRNSVGSELEIEYLRENIDLQSKKQLQIDFQQFKLYFIFLSKAKKITKK